MEDPTLYQIRAANWQFPTPVWNCLSDYEKSFAKNEFTEQRCFDYYVRRLEALGFQNLDSVLDAACGMGQWSLALSHLNRQVEGIDINMERLLVANSLAQSHGADHCQFRFGSIELLPYETATFDAVFCYGAFMFTDMPKALQEFYRVLKPGGKLYLNANSIGWYVHLLWDRGIRSRNRQMVMSTLRIAARTLRGRTSQRIVSQNWLQEQLIIADFQVIEIGREGEINLSSEHPSLESAYPRQFYGFPAILEVVASRGNDK
jgi:ubiquinone/menaquinone biosynthesis C-methylase UbiE